MPIEEINHITEDVLSYMCTLAVQKCSKKSEKKKAACGGEAMRKRLLIKNFVAFLLKQETILKQKKEKMMFDENRANESEDYDFDDESCADGYMGNEHLGLYGNNDSSNNPHPELDDEEIDEDSYEDDEKRLLSDDEMSGSSCPEVRDSMFNFGNYIDGNSVMSDNWEDTNKLTGQKYSFLLSGDDGHDQFSSSYSGMTSSYNDRTTIHVDNNSDCLFDDLSVNDNLGTKNTVFEDDTGFYKKQIKDEYSLNNLENNSYSSCMSPLRTSNCRSEGSFRRLYTDLDTMNTVVEEGNYMLNERIDENLNIQTEHLHEDFSTSNMINSNFSNLTDFDSELSTPIPQTRKRSMSGRFYLEDDYTVGNSSLNYMMLNSSPKRLKL
uniref:CBFD_NFYB_HMF domain-containing protein n=1 Tax=Strongyloides papillosus TaxID=174720 RepID=A0A0N5CET2_STREA